MKTPGSDHPITLKPSPQRMRARCDDHVIADSEGVTMLQEASYPPVAYIPREAVQMAVLTKTAKSTNCPYKGDASYYSIFLDGRLLENVAWSYEEPYPAMEAIRGLVAFYPDKVAVYAVTDEALDERRSAVADGGPFSPADRAG